MVPIRVLHIVDSLSCGSGVLAVIMNLYKHIDRSKVQFDFLVHFEKSPNYEQTIIDMGGKVYHVPTPYLKNILNYGKIVNRFFKEHKEYNIIHGHSPSIAIFYLPFAIKYRVKYRIAHSHNTKYSDSRLKSIRNYFLQFPLKNLANKYIACSKKAGEFLFGYENLRKNKVVILNNAIDTSKFKYNEQIREKYRKQYNLMGKFVIGHIGRFAEQKNHAFMLEFFHEIYKMNNNAVLLLVGGGELEQQIKEKISILKLEKAVLFLGVRSDIDSILQAFDVFVLPSLYEGLPVVCIEAQAAGLKCFISDSITDEVDVTGLVRALDIKKPADFWANLILSEGMEYNRVDTSEIITDAGYDIKTTAMWLTNFYVKNFNDQT